MIPELHALAAQIVALPGWRWLPGLCVTNAEGLRAPLLLAHDSVPGWLPDLTDPATGGVMLGMLSGQLVQAQVTPDGWRVVMVFTDLSPSVSARAATLGEAIARMVVARGGWR